MRKHPLAHCEDCPLYAEGVFVPSTGPEKADIAFVGEAPGVQEARIGVPFSGPSGKLLNIVMVHHGIEREEVMLTNACLCRPRDNATPDTAAIAACRPRLEDELRQHDVRTVVALGNSAAQALLGVSGVTKLRVGPGRPAKNLEGVHVITTLHPAAALRQGDLFPHIVNDVAKVVTPPQHWSPPVFVVGDDERSTLGLLEQLASRPGPFAVDIEVGIDKETSFDHPNHYDMLCVGIAYEKDKVLVIGEQAFKSDKVIQKLGEVLKSKDLIFQNGKFDKAGLYPVVGEIKIWFDTMLASYTFDERPGVHGLDYQGQEHLGTPDWKGVLKPYLAGTNGSYANVPRNILYKYNAYDCAVTYALWEWYEARYQNEAGGADLRKVHNHLVAAANELMFVEMNGFAVDRKYLDELTVSYLDVLEDRRNEINEAIGWKQYDGKVKGINPNSPLQVKKYLADVGVETESTDEEHINFILEQAPKAGLTHADEITAFCSALLEHRREAKLYGTYIKGIRKRLYGGRVHPTYNLHGTTSGRLACRNPNLQNIPRDSSIRRLYVPSKPEHVLVGVDYSQAELRVLSYLARDTYFRDIFNADQEDLFDNLTPLLYGPDKTKAAVEAGVISKAEWTEMRIRVKAFVYGLGYGRKHFSIAAEYGMPVDEAKRIMDNFFEVIPEIVEFRAEVMRKVLHGEDLITPWGRHRRYTLITKENRDKTMNEALSFLPQSTASDMCLDALIYLRPALKGIGWIRNTVHDALYAECHEDDAEEVAIMMDKQMVESAQKIVGDYVLFKTDAHIARDWGSL
jgi:uracil-DNA glycosylase family 4